MQIQKNVSLKPYNTFGIDVNAEQFVELHDIGELEAIGALSEQRHALGGGSNILLSKDISGLVIANRLKGITIEKENEDHVWVRAQAGEVWHELVLYAIGKGWAGIENLALIPGTVGAAPIQNIGAYGVEAKETIETVTGWHWQDKNFLTFANKDCGFGYRDSIFKHALKDQLFITSVLFRLNKKPVFHTAYGAISEELQRMGVAELSIKAIANAVIAIRSSKLPDPKKIGNAGSFFKNPTISPEHFELLQTNYPNIPSYPAAGNMIKVPAGWMIEQCGWKGHREGETGVHAKQALVLVNYGNAKGNEVWQLSEEIVQSVKERFGTVLEREVQVW